MGALHSSLIWYFDVAFLIGSILCLLNMSSEMQAEADSVGPL